MGVTAPSSGSVSIMHSGNWKITRAGSMDPMVPLWAIMCPGLLPGPISPTVMGDMIVLWASEHQCQLTTSVNNLPSSTSFLSPLYNLLNKWLWVPLSKD